MLIQTNKSLWTLDIVVPKFTNGKGQISYTQDQDYRVTNIVVELRGNKWAEREREREIPSIRVRTKETLKLWCISPLNIIIECQARIFFFFFIFLYDFYYQHFMLYYNLSHFLLYSLCLLLFVPCLSCDLQSLNEITNKSLRKKDGSSTCEDFVSLIQKWLRKIKVSWYIHNDCFVVVVLKS